MTLIANPVDVSLVTQAIVDMLSQSAREALQNVLVQRSEEIPNEPPANGWIGVYRQDDDYRARAVGMGTGYRQQYINLVILIQACDLETGANCENRLEAMVSATVGEILTDPNLRSTVEMLDTVRAQRDRYERLGTGFIQYAAIYVTAIQPVKIVNV